MPLKLLPGTGTLFDKKDEELAIAIKEALAPIINKTVASGTLLPNCPLNGQQFFLQPDQMNFYYDQIRNLWLSLETFTYQFGRRSSIGNNILLRATDAMPTNQTGVAIPFDGESVVVGMAADWANTVATANFQVQANGFISIVNLTASNASYASDFTLSGLIPNGDYLTVRTNGLSSNVIRPEVKVYVKKYKLPV